MRSLLKKSAEILLCSGGVARAARMAYSADVLVLAYHNIVPDGEPVAGDKSLHLPQREFARQLDRLLSTHEVVTLDQAMSGVVRRRRPRVVITFDDAYRGAVTAGVEELVRRSLPATIFVAPAFVDGGTFWWDVFADESGLPSNLRRHGLEVLQGKDDRVRAWCHQIGVTARSVPQHQTVASESELQAVVHHPGIALASHTWSHANVSRLPATELEDEMVRPLLWLRERFAQVVPWIAYPYGLFSYEAEQAAEAAGYAGALRVDGGWLGDSMVNDRFALPRFNVPAGLSLRGFELRTSGLLQR